MPRFRRGFKRRRFGGGRRRRRMSAGRGRTRRLRIGYRM